VGIADVARHAGLRFPVPEFTEVGLEVHLIAPPCHFDVRIERENHASPGADDPVRIMARPSLCHGPPVRNGPMGAVPALRTCRHSTRAGGMASHVPGIGPCGRLKRWFAHAGHATR